MRSDTHGSTITSPAPGVIPDTIIGPWSDQPSVRTPNTAQVTVDWLIGSSHILLAWLVLVTAIVGWLPGLMASARFNCRPRAPRRQSRAR